MPASTHLATPEASPPSPSGAVVIPGRARQLGDDINTDYIISSRRKKDTLDGSILRRYLLEDLDPGFAATVHDGDILVAGHNFGCGSAMEVAVTVVLAAGIRVVVARSFARTYWRNAVNNGLLLVTADTDALHERVREGDAIALHLNGTHAELRGAGSDADSTRAIPCEPIPEIVLTIRDAGGLVPYLRQHRQFVRKPAPSSGT